MLIKKCKILILKIFEVKIQQGDSKKAEPENLYFNRIPMFGLYKN